MGLFSPFGGGKKMNLREWSKTGGVKTRIMSLMPGSLKQRQKKITEIEAAILPTMDQGGNSKLDDGTDAKELEEAMGYLRKEDRNLDVNKEDIEIAHQEIKKEI